MKIFIKGYFKKNLGDDLFLKIILERYKSHQFFFNADETYYKSFHHLKNFELLPPEPEIRLGITQRIIMKIVRILSNSNFSLLSRFYQSFLFSSIKAELNGKDGYLVIGGSMFMQAPGIDYKNEEYIEIYRTVVNRFDSIKKFMLGANFGPYRDNAYLKDCRNILAGFQDVCFRDSYSKKLFKDQNNIRYAPDIVFNLDITPYRSNINNSKIIGFSLVEIKKFKHEHGITESSYINAWKQIITTFLHNEYTLKFFSFSASEGDEILINTLLDGIATGYENYIVKIFYKNDIDIVLKEIGTVDTFICSRFHSMILAILFGKKIIPISYSKKMDHVLEDLKYEGRIFNINTFMNLNIDSIESASRIDNNELAITMKKAETQFDEFDKFIHHVK